jgi:hypothetical protein
VDFETQNRMLRRSGELYGAIAQGTRGTMTRRIIRTSAAALPRGRTAGDVGSRRWATGSTPGMNGDLKIDPGTGYVMVVLSNLDPPAATDIPAFMHERV